MGLFKSNIYKIYFLKNETLQNEVERDFDDLHNIAPFKKKTPGSSIINVVEYSE